MSNTRLIKSFLGAAAASSVWYKTTNLETGIETDRGTIEHVQTDKDKHGKFININKMYFKHESEPGTTSPTDIIAELYPPRPMDLQQDIALINKAQKYCEEKTMVEVKYRLFLSANPFTEKPSQQVIAIEEEKAKEENKIQFSK